MKYEIDTPTVQGRDIREEATMLYAAGKDRRAIDAILGHLHATRGQCDQTVWMLLLDLYQLTDQREAFDKLAAYFSKQFGASPPAWIEAPHKGRDSRGRNALVIDGSIALLSQKRIIEVFAEAKTHQFVRLDLSRAQLTGQDWDDDSKDRDDGLVGLNRLVGLMGDLRKARVPALLMGETHLMNTLADGLALLAAGRVRPETRNSPPSGHNNQSDQSDQSDQGNDELERLDWWRQRVAAEQRFVLEVLQWRGDETAFEARAEVFAQVLGLSPPDYDQGGAIARMPVAQVEDDQHHRLDEGFVEDGYEASPSWQSADVVDQDEINRWTSRIRYLLEQQGLARIDCAGVVRVSYEAATGLAGFLHRTSSNKDAIVFDRMSLMLWTLFEMTGVCALATCVLRKPGK